MLHSFTGGADGSLPTTALIRDSAGNLYGTTVEGGLFDCPQSGSCGVVFELSRSGVETVLHSFTGPPDGELPYGNLTRDSAGNLYGTTQQGGFAGCSCGVVYKLDPSGNETVLYSFTGEADGGNPGSGALILDETGNLHGTTYAGGETGSSSTCGIILGCGVVFKLDQAGNESVLYTFTGQADGGYPGSGLVRDRQGNLYGTTDWDGEYSGFEVGYGVVFKLSPTGTETVLDTFDLKDGAYPAALFPYKGYLYGTTSNGGDLSGCGEGCGEVFKVVP